MFIYRVKVRQETFLWGGAGVAVATKSKAHLHFRVDETGEPISVTVIKNDGQDVIGTLRPGECYTVKLENVKGVKAVCDPEQHDTFVDCAILSTVDG
jgi:hypothetical protein